MTFRISGALILSLAALFVSGCDGDSSLPEVVPAPDVTLPGYDVGLDGAVDMQVPIDMTIQPDLGATGDGCDENRDCLYGYCVPGPEGNLVCTNQCREDEDCPEGWECRPVLNTRPDTVFICVASRRVQCLPCNHDGDCGGGADRCIEIGDSTRCARDCSTEDCPEGNSCVDVEIDGESVPLCTPDEETCAPCVDPDGDGYGNEGECLGLDCDEEDPLNYEGAAERCDGLDNDCDTIPDNDIDLSTAPAELSCIQEGVCQGAAPSCIEGAWGCNYPATYEIDAELTCDGLDNDCDGVVDEAIQPPPARLIVGLCVGAVQVCAGDAGHVEPDYAAIEGYEQEETTCDGLDNDCDNITDEGGESPAAELQAGVCAGARKVCAGDGGYAEPDYAQFMGYENVETTCDGLDNDCDGQTDEALQPPLADNQAGVCSGAQRVCAGVDGFVEPDYPRLAGYEAMEVTCDGLDNDCNGQVDDALELPPGDRQQGVCGGSIKVCAGQDGLQEPDYGALVSYENVEATCDGLDNDCDGDQDEGLQAPPGENQNGVCSGSLKVCDGPNGFIEPDYAAMNGHEANEATCDGLDNDCDGTADEAIVPPPALIQAGVCAGAVQVCAGQQGFVEPDYLGRAGYENVEASCDGQDNDCDGSVDEALTPPLGDNQAGVCSGSVRRCDGDNGFIEPDYAAIEGHQDSETVCDGLDNDCDGQTDEDVMLPFADRQRGVCGGQRRVCAGGDGLVEPDYLLIATYEGDEVTCDGLDNDCDGFVDENVAQPLADNQQGICQGSRKLCRGAEGFVNPAIASLPGYIAADTPIDNLDTNCDGVIGDADGLIYVSPLGDDRNSGLTPDAPLRTIAGALAKSANVRNRDLAIASGAYVGDSPLNLQSGVSLFGGFGRNFDSRDASRAVFTTSSSVGIQAVNLGAATQLDQMEVIVTNQGDESQEAIGGIIVDSASNLLLSNTRIQAGRGGNGVMGANGANGNAGGFGSQGSGQTGGRGGAGGGGAGASGRRQNSGPGGSSGANNNALGGNGGSGSGGGGLGCGDGDPRDGGHAANGSAGPDGADNDAGNNVGRFVGLDWEPPVGSGGARGGQGGGGGGGGAGGGEDCEACVLGACQCLYCGTGRGGGGGGGGGTGGLGGSPGTSGGASIGLVISTSRVSLVNTIIVTSRGGVGGWGGAGGVGGAGGPGGSGASNNDDSDGDGGDGGNGGRGGHGGCGAGGSGGPSVVFWGLDANAGVIRVGDQEDTLGAGGLGGPSCGNRGPAGLSRRYYGVDVTNE